MRQKQTWAEESSPDLDPPLHLKSALLPLLLKSSSAVVLCLTPHPMRGMNCISSRSEPLKRTSHFDVPHQSYMEILQSWFSVNCGSGSKGGEMIRLHKRTLSKVSDERCQKDRRIIIRDASVSRADRSGRYIGCRLAVNIDHSP